MSVPTKNIMGKLEDLEKKTAADPLFAKKLGQKAIDAICEGPTSEAWEIYMKEVVGPDAPEQLKRLKLMDDAKDDAWVRKNCAYIVSNAVCGTGTTTRTLYRVDDSIDADLSAEPVAPV